MPRTRLIRTGCAVLVSILSISLLMSKEPEKKDVLPVLKTKPKILTVFKNGLGFFLRDGETDLRDGWAVTEHVPGAALGTLWVTSLDEGTVVEETVSFMDEVEREEACGSLDALLAANVGKKIKVTAHNQVLEGRIKAVPGQLLVLAPKDENEIALNRNSVIKLEFQEAYSALSPVRTTAKRMKFRVTGRKPKARLRLAYLQKGVTWTPSYLVNIEDPDKARLTMKATLVNDAEDLEDAEIFFVVGFPNFRFADVLSPMALDRNLLQFLNELEQGERRGRDRFQQLGNIMSQRVAASEVDASLDFGYGDIPWLAGEAEEDLFLYSKRGVHLAKGARAEYPIFSQAVDYKHVYEWTIPDTLNVDSFGHQRNRQAEEAGEQIWHSLKLTNATEFPWTTAPALTVSGTKPLAQEVLSYTPRGTSNNLKMTLATDIKATKHEYEAERQRDVQLYSYRYDLVTIRGELTVKNAKDKDVILEIKKSVTGDVLETSHSGKTQKTAEGLRGINSNSLISWEIPVKAGETVKVTYAYKVYIRH